MSSDAITTPTVDVWQAGAKADWSATANWSTDAIPTSNARAIIGGDSVVSSTASDDPTVASIVIADGAKLEVAAGTFTVTGGIEKSVNAGTFTVANGVALALGGTFANHGSIKLLGSTNQTQLEIKGTALTLTGGGRVTLSDSEANAIVSDGTAATLTNVNNTIAGAGTIGDTDLILLNRGVIAANTTSALTIDTGANAITNSGKIESTASGGLDIKSDIVNSGTLIATAGALKLEGGLTGNAAKIAHTGRVEIAAADSSDDVTFVAGATGRLVLDHSQTYHGTITGFGLNNSPNAFIDLADVNFENQAPQFDTATDTLTISDNEGDIARLHIIGNFHSSNFHLTDDGHGHVLIADPITPIVIHNTPFAVTLFPLIISNQDVIFTSTLANGSTLQVNNGNHVVVEGTVQNSASFGLGTAFGTLETTGASQLTLESTFTNPASRVLKGHMQAIDQSDITVEGSVTNSGTITASNLAAIIMESSVLNNNAITSSNASLIKINGGVTNLFGIQASDNSTIDLAGTINNDGSLIAQNNSTMNIAPSDVFSFFGGMTNNGLVEVADNAQLNVKQSNSALNNNGTLEAVGNGVAFLNGSVANAGRLEAAGAGKIFVVGNLTDAGALAVNGDGALAVGGTATGAGLARINDQGLLVFNNQSSVDVSFGSPSQISGGGELKLSFEPSSGATLLGSGYTGTITAFTLGDSIDLTYVPFTTGDGGTSFSYVPNINSTTGGTLTVVSSNTTNAPFATLAFGGEDPNLGNPIAYTSGSFHVQSDNHGGTLITDPFVVEQPPGNAPATIANNTVLEINTADSGAVTFAGSIGTLLLDPASAFSGTVTGFSKQNGIDLAEIGFNTKTTVDYTANSEGTGGMLTVSDGTHSAAIALLGNYMASSFVTASDRHGGTLISVAAQTVQQGELTLPHA